MTAPLPSLDDHEAKIEATNHAHQLASALDDYFKSKGGPETERMRLWIRFSDLHAKRSPTRVAEMEKQQGLR